MLFDPDQFLSTDWAKCLDGRFDARFWEGLEIELGRKPCGPVYPAPQDVFRAFELAPLEETKVVILGQDPYHSPGLADGLCFSVHPGRTLPASLRNILSELSSDLRCPSPKEGSLEAWARQGVLLLNTVLTVCEGEANSHARLGWESFTDQVIACAWNTRDPVFVLWGCAAHRKGRRLLVSNAQVVSSTHPADRSRLRRCKHARPFTGSKPFSWANDRLHEAGRPPIEWCLEP